MDRTPTFPGTGDRPETEVRPGCPAVADTSDARPRWATSGGTAKGGATWPGVWPASAVTLLSTLACWYGVLPPLAAGDRPPVAAGVSELADVAADDIPAALATVDPRSYAVSQLGRRARDCGQKLAWVTLARRSGEPPGEVLLKSGAYVSPVFVLPETPLRVAIPYPAPYESGRGELTVLSTGGDGLVALTPPWHVKAGAINPTRTVTWRPSGGCAPGGG